MKIQNTKINIDLTLKDVLERIKQLGYKPQSFKDGYDAMIEEIIYLLRIIK